MPPAAPKSKDPAAQAAALKERLDLLVTLALNRGVSQEPFTAAATIAGKLAAAAPETRFERTPQQIRLAVAEATGKWELLSSSGEWLPAPFNPPKRGAEAGKRGKFTFQGKDCEIEFSSPTEGTVTSAGKKYKVRVELGDRLSVAHAAAAVAALSSESEARLTEALSAVAQHEADGKVSMKQLEAFVRAFPQPQERPPLTRVRTFEARPKTETPSFDVAVHIGGDAMEANPKLQVQGKLVATHDLSEPLDQPPTDEDLLRNRWAERERVWAYNASVWLKVKPEATPNQRHKLGRILEKLWCEKMQKLLGDSIWRDKVKFRIAVTDSAYELIAETKLGERFPLGPRSYFSNYLAGVLFAQNNNSEKLVVEGSMALPLDLKALVEASKDAPVDLVAMLAQHAASFRLRASSPDDAWLDRLKPPDDLASFLERQHGERGEESAWRPEARLLAQTHRELLRLLRGTGVTLETAAVKPVLAELSGVAEPKLRQLLRKLPVPHEGAPLQLAQPDVAHAVALAFLAMTGGGGQVWSWLRDDAREDWAEACEAFGGLSSMQLRLRCDRRQDTVYGRSDRESPWCAKQHESGEIRFELEFQGLEALGAALPSIEQVEKLLKAMDGEDAEDSEQAEQLEGEDAEQLIRASGSSLIRASGASSDDGSSEKA